MQKSFTLIELTVSLFVILMLGILSISFYTGLQSKKSEALINQLQQLIIYAEVSAATNNTPVTICPLDQNNQCIGQWQHTIAVFYDLDKVHRLLSSEDLLKQYEPPKGLRGDLIYSAFSSNRYITFMPLAISGQQNGTFVYCENALEGKILLGLSISKSGRTRRLDANDEYFKGKNYC